jgi:GT2 family glycosyltransferase
MMRVSALQQVGPFNPAIIAAEDSELCARLRLAGWRIARLDAEMGTHDAAITRFSQWWRRMTRAGHGFAENAALHGHTRLRHWVKETRSNWAWGLLLPLAACAFAWPTRGISLAVAALAYLALFLKIRRPARRRGLAPSDASLYARFSTLAKLPLAIGQAKYRLNRARGRRQNLIEYKRPAPQPAPTP